MNLKIRIMALAALSLVTTGFSADKKADKDHETVLSQTGGLIERPNTKKGCVLFYNRQTRVAPADLEKLFTNVYEDVPLPFVLTNAPNPKAGVVVEIIDDPAKPVLLAAPEDWWASVNVAKLSNGLRNEVAIKKFLPARIRKEMIRALAFACGVGSSQFPGNLLRMESGRELDYLDEFFPVDVASRMVERLAKRGVTPADLVTYADACEEGWAPKPTNKYQQAVWTKARAVPDKPMTIKFDPKTDK